MAGPLVSIKNLTVALPTGADRALAVEDVSLEVGRKELVCIVGESGSGKSITAHAIMGLLPRGVTVTSGSIHFNGVDLLKEPPDAMRKRRGRDIAMIFQDPMAALNPVMTIGAQVTEQIRAHRAISQGQALKQAGGLLDQMGLADVAGLLKAYPHQLSGGQRQRAMIAMALSLSPQLLIADEPTTALDVTTQAQILGLIKRIQTEREMSVLLITHDFGVVADMADQVAVMHHGAIVESGTVKAVLGQPAHAYTSALIAAVPRGESLLAPLPDAPPVVQVTGLTKRFRRGGLFSRSSAITAVDNVSLTLSPGETLGIVGESGSGKSTLARCVIRLLDPDAGTVLLDRRRHRPYESADLAASAPPHPDGVPGSFFLPQSAPDDRRYHHRRTARLWRRCQGRRAPAPPTSCGWSASVRKPWTACRMNFPAASASASAWRAP